MKSAGFVGALVADSPSPLLGERAADFDWLVGSWSATVRDYQDDGGYRESTGEWWFSWVLDGRALQDVWIVPDRRSPQALRGEFSRYGTTIRTLERDGQTWRIAWNNPASGARNELTGQRQGDRIVLEGVAGDSRIRWSFNEITANGFTWRGEEWIDGRWRLSAEFVLVRSDASSRAAGWTCDHLDIRVGDLQRARAFYDPFCAAVGLSSAGTSSQWVVYESGDPSAPFVAITAEPDMTPSATRVAFRANSIEEVDRIAAVAKRSGATQFEEPHFCPEYSERYYASFFGDPDGNLYEVCYR